jgi:catechol 2,3-dioxygenase-like lactoylglutathione lyase family enzyme
MNLNQVTIPSKDLEKSLRFYLKLGLELIVDALPGYLRFKCPEGGSTFSIHLQETLAGNGGIIVYFESEKLDAEVVRLMHEGLLFDELPNDKSWLWREARLKDPDGNQIILYWAGENRINPPWRVKL